MAVLRSIATILFSGLVGGVVTAAVYERKLTRVAEERAIYLALATSALATSDKAFTFASGYQQTLDICLSRMYATPTTVAVVPATKQGGLGGPNLMRGNSRLP